MLMLIFLLDFAAAITLGVVAGMIAGEMLDSYAAQLITSFVVAYLLIRDRHTTSPE